MIFGRCSSNYFLCRKLLFNFLVAAVTKWKLYFLTHEHRARGQARRAVTSLNLETRPATRHRLSGQASSAVFCSLCARISSAGLSTLSWKRNTSKAFTARVSRISKIPARPSRVEKTPRRCLRKLPRPTTHRRTLHTQKLRSMDRKTALVSNCCSDFR
jgi:hypothetical protein